MKLKALFIALIVIPTFSNAATDKTPVNSDPQSLKESLLNMKNKSFFTQKTLRWEWTEGDYTGAVYENTFNADGSMVWKGIRGGEKGQSRTEQYIAYDIAEDVSAASWFEPIVGATVNVILNTKDHEIYGFISDKDSRVALKGKFTVIN